MKVLVVFSGLCLVLLAGAAQADMTPTQARASFKQWQLEANQILSAQPKNSSARSELDVWLKDQGASFSKIAEPLRSSTVAPKVWGTAAYVMDTANRNAEALSHVQYRALLALSQRIMGECFAAYQPKRSVCTDSRNGDLRLQNTLYLAKLDGNDRDGLMANIPNLIAESAKPLSGGFFEADASEALAKACSSGIRTLARHLGKDYYPYGETQGPAFYSAYFSAAQGVLSQCEASLANDSMISSHLTELGVSALARAGDNAQLKNSAKPFAQRAYDLLSAQLPGGGTAGARPTDLARLLVLANGLGKPDAARWAKALPEQLRLDAANGGEFPCNYLRQITENLGQAWPDVLAKYPLTAEALSAICR